MAMPSTSASTPPSRAGYCLSNLAAYTWINLQSQVPGRTATTESKAVELEPADKLFLRDECVRVFGVVAGTQTVTRTLTGANNEVPLIAAYAAWGSSPKGSSGYGCQ
jgi:hypothetical protein